jgi:outer membrane receptor for ferrienterochelin and colicin
MQIILKKKRGLLFCLMQASATVADSAWAQSVEPSIQSVEISGSRFNQRKEETTAKVVIGRGDLLRYGDSNLSDALKRVPGITVAGEVKLRGLGNGYTQILLNGEQTPPGFSVDSISPELVERIEVIRSATVEYGTEAIAGTINIVLRRTVSRQERTVTTGAERTDGGTAPSLALQVSDRSGRLSYNVAGVLKQTKNLERPTIEVTGTDGLGNLDMLRYQHESNLDRYDIVSLAPRVNWNLDNGQTLSWQSFVDVRRNIYKTFMQETPVFGASSIYPLVSTDTNSLTSTVRTDANWTRNIGAGQLNVKVGASAYHRDKDYVFLGFDGPSSIGERQDVQSTQDDTAFNATGRYSRPLAQSHQLATGWDISRIRRRESRLEDRTGDAGQLLGHFDERYSAIVKKLAFYAQDELTLNDRWQMYLGVRWDGLFTVSTSNIAEIVDNRIGVWSPVLQTKWRVAGSEKDQLRIGLAHTFKAPTTASLIPRRYVEYNDNSPANPSRQGNPALRPERAWGFDFAYEHYIGNGGLLSASAFVRRIQDVTMQHLYQERGMWILSPGNNGGAKVAGVELETKLPVREIWRNAPNIETRINLAWNWSSLDEVAGPHRRLDQQIPFSMNIGADYRMTDNVSVGANFHASKGTYTSLAEGLDRYLGSKRLLDVYGLWRLDPKTQLRFSMANIVPKDFDTAVQYASDTTGLGRRSALPSTRTIKLLVEHKF